MNVIAAQSLGKIAQFTFIFSLITYKVTQALLCHLTSLLSVRVPQHHHIAEILASFLPAVLANGTTEGVDGSFWTGLAIVMIRTSVLTTASAVLAISLATVGRNTAFAVITMFTWLIVVEGLIRGLKPSLARWLWAENLGTVMTWAQLETGDFARGPVVAASTLFVYCAVIVGLAAVSFHRRDIAAAT